MFPWLWFWSPQVHLPLSGDVAQRIAPVNHLFFQGISPDAGDARIEEDAFHVATYGHQLGLITDVLLDLSRRMAPGTPEGEDALRELRQVADEIDRVKRRHRARAAGDIEAELTAMRRRGGPEFERLAERLRPLLEPPPPAAG